MKKSFFPSLTLNCVIVSSFSLECYWDAVGQEIEICKRPCLRQLFISTAENSELQSACFLSIFYGLLKVLTTVRILRGREVKWLVCGYLANDAGGVGIQIVLLPSWNPDNCRYFAKCSVCRKQTDSLSTHPTSLLIFSSQDVSGFKKPSVPGMYTCTHAHPLNWHSVTSPVTAKGGITDYSHPRWSKPPPDDG